VPQIQIGATAGGKGAANVLVEMMLSMLVADRIGPQTLPDAVAEPVEEE
jgi:hypothetical protein